MGAAAPRVVGGELLDGEGRRRLLRGVNVGLKRPPFLPPHSAAQAAALVADRGVDLVRLFIAWRALAPAPGAIDAGYLRGVREAVERWHAAGAWVLLDLHQDLWGGPFLEHGAPEWATLGRRLRGLPRLPLPAGASWQLRYADPRVVDCFEALLADRRVPGGRGLQAHLAEAWAALARELRGHPGVLAFDLWNEPFAGRELLAALRSLAGAGLRALPALLRDPLQAAADPAGQRRALARLRVPAERAHRRWGRLYARLTAAIHTEDPQRAVALEPLGPVGVGLPAAPPAAPPGARALYAPHLYDALVECGLPWDGVAERQAATLAQHAAAAAQLGAPLLVGEWGNATPRAGDPLAFLRATRALLDRAGASACYWEHTPGMDEALLDAIFAPRPMALAGRLQGGFDARAGLVFTLVREQAAGRSEVWLPERLGEWRVETDEPGAQVTRCGDRVHIVHKQAGEWSYHCRGE